MNASTIYTSERNGYEVKVYEYEYKGKQRFGARVTNLTTGNSEQNPGFSSYRTALEVAQQAADEAKI